MSLDGTQVLRTIDPGDGTLFRTAAGGHRTIEVEGGSTLNVGGFTQMALVKVVTEGISSFLNIASSSTTDALIIGDGSLPASPPASSAPPARERSHLPPWFPSPVPSACSSPEPSACSDVAVGEHQEEKNKTPCIRTSSRFLNGTLSNSP